MNDRAAHALIEGRTPIVVIGDDWGRHVSTTQHLFRRLVDRYPVVWVNSFGHRRPQLTLYDAKRAFGKLARMSRPATPVRAEDGPRPRRVIDPKALPWHDKAAVRGFNSWSIARDVRRALDAVAPGEAPLLVVVTPAAYGLVGRLGEIGSIYLCLDDYGQLPGVEADLIAPLEQELLRRVDALVATSKSLTISKRPASGRTLHLPQGVNYAHFAEPQALPADFAALPRPIIGFAGAFGPAIDFPLIRRVAEAFPAASLAFVGPWQIEVHPRDWPANVHFLGNRPYAVLPAYVQRFDVGLVPYVHNDWTRAVDPLKLLEYLAAGIPVVSTCLPEAYKYESEVRLADEPDAFVAEIRAALAGNGPAARASRQALAGRNRWEDRAEAFVVFAQTVVGAGRVETSPT